MEFQSVAQEDQQVLVERNQEMRKTTNERRTLESNDKRPQRMDQNNPQSDNQSWSEWIQPTQKSAWYPPSRTVALLGEIHFQKKLVYRKHAKKRPCRGFPLSRPSVHSRLMRDGGTMVIDCPHPP